MNTDATAATWPFWAPSDAASVEAALDLAAVGPRDRLVDLGCGDGQVLLAAAARGAEVTGIEADPDLAEQARANLAEAGVDADVRTSDLFDPDLCLEADVFFSYLAPATLQRLLPRLTVHRARLVTVDFGVPGLVPTRRSGDARLYALPGRRRPVGAPGWPSAGTLVATVPDHQSLSCLGVVHPGGDASVGLTGDVAEIATVLAGSVRLDAAGHLAVDIRWEPMAPGTVAGGAVTVAGVGEHGLFVVATADEEEGMWDLTGAAVCSLHRALGGSQPPATVAELLDAGSG